MVEDVPAPAEDVPTPARGPGVRRVAAAFMWGVLLGVLWELAAMGVLVMATVTEHYFGTLIMATVFLGLVSCIFAVAARADLGWPLFSILLFRLTAQIAMTIGTGSVLLTTILQDTPLCSSDRLNVEGWRAPVVRLLADKLPHRWMRRIVGVQPPNGPAFLRVLAAMATPSILSLPGTVAFRSEGSAEQHWARSWSASELGALADADVVADEDTLSGMYTYSCRDSRYGDYDYSYHYQAFWLRPAASIVLHTVGSLLIKMLLMHAYAACFMLLSQGNCRDAFVAECRRRVDRSQRWLWPRPPVREIPVEPGDLCAFCHEEILRPSPDAPDDAAEVHHVHCRWGCGKAVHKQCAAGWERNSCVYCGAPMS